jgi:hypothetical protein
MKLITVITAPTIKVSRSINRVVVLKSKITSDTACGISYSEQNIRRSKFNQIAMVNNTNVAHCNTKSLYLARRGTI